MIPILPLILKKFVISVLLLLLYPKRRRNVGRYSRANASGVAPLSTCNLHASSHLRLHVTSVVNRAISLQFAPNRRMLVPSSKIRLLLAQQILSLLSNIYRTELLMLSPLPHMRQLLRTCYILPCPRRSCLCD